MLTLIIAVLAIVAANLLLLVAAWSACRHDMRRAKRITLSDAEVFTRFAGIVEHERARTGSEEP